MTNLKTELEELQGTYSDVHKDVYGFRPRFDSSEYWNSVEWLKSQLSRMYSELKEIIEQDKENEKRAIAEFEILVDKTISMGAGNRKTALRWIIDGSDCDGNLDFLCYTYGLPYNYLK